VSILDTGALYSLLEKRRWRWGGRAAEAGVEMPLSTAATALGLYGAGCTAYCGAMGSKGPLYMKRGRTKAPNTNTQHPTRKEAHSVTRSYSLLLSVDPGPRFAPRRLGVCPGGEGPWKPLATSAPGLRSPPRWCPWPLALGFFPPPPTSLAPIKGLGRDLRVW
jgi:hypothetical protein